MQSTWKTVQAIFHKVSLFQRKVFTWIFLQAIYLFGMGLTSIVARLSGAKFLGQTSANSSWKSHENKVSTKAMY